MDKKRKIYRDIYFRLNKTRRSKHFKFIEWISINLLKFIYLLFLFLTFFFLIRNDLFTSFLSLICFIGFLFIHGFFSLKREENILFLLDLLKKDIKNADNNSLIRRIRYALLEDIRDYGVYEVPSTETNLSKDFELLITYIDYFLSYRDFRDINSLNQTNKFFSELSDVFENHSFSRIPELIKDDFLALKSPEEFRRVSSLIKSRNPNLDLNKNIFEILSYINKREEKNFWPKILHILIELLKIIDRYKWGVIILTILILIVMFLFGKISSEQLQVLKDIFPLRIG